MKVKTALLSGIALRYAVYLAMKNMVVKKVEEVKWEDDSYWLLWPDGKITHSVEIPSSAMNRQYRRVDFAPDEDDLHGGEILDHYCISTVWDGSTWIGSLRDPAKDSWHHNQTGRTRLIAGMRAFVSYRLGAEVELPDGINCN